MKNLVFFALIIVMTIVIANEVTYLRFLREVDRERKDPDAYYVTELMSPIIAFQEKYHQWPGSSGEINDAFICELTGGSDAKINSQHINFCALYGLTMIRKNKFGYFYIFKLNNKKPGEFYIKSIVPDAKNGLRAISEK